MTAVAAGCLEPEGSSRVRWILEGVANGLDNPADIAIHPAGRYLVIANREASGLCFFTLPPDLRMEPPRLVLSRTVAELNGERTAAPHGVAFSPDGRFLFVTHKRFFKSQSDTGNSAVSVYRADADSFDRAQWLPVAARDFGREALHHVACHPSGRIIALTNSLGPVELLSWNPSSRDFTEVGSIDIFRQGEGAKGICFTKDGHYLAVTSELDEVLFFDLRRHTSFCGIMQVR
jgi:6-phosphogluconolactonase (cycloisomerase 2 family)